MLETAIVGGGLCGLALARSLHQDGHEVALFEARPRLGGRVLSTSSESTRQRVDLGPTWFWPDSQPLITQRITELELDSFLQHDEGQVLVLQDPEKPPKIAQLEGVHSGARRLVGGMTSMIEALARDLPPERVHAGHVLHAVVQRPDGVQLEFRNGGARVFVLARRVVLAVPPRLLAEQVHFEPALESDLLTAMHETPTWMATTAKAIVRYARAVWRDAGHSGNAFVQHERVVLDEIFDACDASGELAALGGFFALPPEVRRNFRAGMGLLLASQMTQVFGPSLGEIEQHVHDWAGEPFTCSERDLNEADPTAAHPRYGSALLADPCWDGRVHFAGSETADREGGYLEGALEAALRVQRELASVAHVVGVCAQASGVSP
ncbi:MAG TPA: FAD-dependent oxidoreductase [Polyangiales bacterium]